MQKLLLDKIFLASTLPVDLKGMSSLALTQVMVRLQKGKAE